MSATISHEDLGDELRRIVITGRLDTPGTNAIAPELAELAAVPKRGIVVDLSAVEFVSSMGIGQLIVNAKAVRSRGGILVLIVSGTSIVMTSLKVTGVDQLIPVYQYAPEAYAAALRGF
jgi:anti-anti-sigma factor